MAIAASIFLHLLIAYSLAAFAPKSTTPVEDEKAPELTFIDLAPTPPPITKKNPAYMETDPSKASAQKPKEQTFESNANSIAASTLPATGDAPLPSQQGKERPFVQTETHASSLAMEGATPRPQATPVATPEVKPTPAATPKPASSQTPKPTPVAAPLVTPEPEQFAMLKATPPPPIRAPDEAETSPTPDAVAPTPLPTARPRPERPSSAFQAEKEQTKITGRISTRGPSSVNAVGTPLGRYQKQVSDAIGSRWYYYMKKKMDMVSIGTAQISAEVDERGHVQRLRVVSNNANEAFANICLQSFQEAQIPPIPPDLAAALPDGKLAVDFSFTAYANQ